MSLNCPAHRLCSPECSPAEGHPTPAPGEHGTRRGDSGGHGKALGTRRLEERTEGEERLPSASDRKGGEEEALARRVIR